MKYLYVTESYWMQIFIYLTYKREEFVVHKTTFGMGKLLRKGYVIADWNIRLEEDMYHIEMNVYDEDYIEDQYLLLGVFHAVLYGDRCINEKYRYSL